MAEHRTTPAFVIKAEELPILSRMRRDYPSPRRLEWINRGTDQRLRPTTVQMLLRTLFKDTPSPSIGRLHNSTGLRVVFGTDAELRAFSLAFQKARSSFAEPAELSLIS
jgi:hypothetical protein